jgi:tetratricopeptide (TPR) repeat protein
MSQPTKPILATPQTPSNVPAAVQSAGHTTEFQNSSKVFNIAQGILQREASLVKLQGNAEPWRRHARELEAQLRNSVNTHSPQNLENGHQLKRYFEFSSVFHHNFLDRIFCLHFVVQECLLAKQWLDALSICQEMENLLELLARKKLKQEPGSSQISWREVASCYPDIYITTLLIRAICCMKTKHYVQGILGFQEAFLRRPYEIRPNDRLIICMFMKHSILALKEYEELDPGSTLLIQGEYYLRLHDFDQAIEVLINALNLKDDMPAPSHQHLYALAKRLLYNGQHLKREDLLEMAQYYFDWALDRPMLQNERICALAGLYNAYSSLKKFPEALRILKLLEFFEDKKPDFWIGQAQCYHKLEDIPQALAAFRKAYELGRHSFCKIDKNSLLEISQSIQSLDPELAQKFQEWANRLTHSASITS